MSYARWSEASSVYVFASSAPKWNRTAWLECCGCSLRTDHDLEILDFKPTLCNSTDEMLAHLEEHMIAGHDVPGSCLDALERDRAENDADIAAYLERAA